MKINRNYIRKVAVLFFALMIAFNAYPQQDLTIHLMPVIPQSSYTNPAFKPIPKGYIGFPLLSSVYLGLGHSGFAYKDVFHYSSTDDSLHFMDGTMLSKLAKTNYLSANVNEEFFCFGFKAKKSYFSFSVSDKMNFQLSYPKELVNLLSYGNGQYVGTTGDFSGLGVNASYYREYAFGFSRDVRIFNQKFVIGGRYKILRGMADVYTKSKNASWGINQDDFGYTANEVFLINMTLPDPAIEKLDSIGHKSNNNNNNNNNNKSNFDAGKFLTNKTNKGMAIDLGISYKLNNSWTFGASMLDFGYINWNTGGGSSVRNYSSNTNNFIFNGLDVGQFLGLKDSVMKIKENDMLDSIGSLFQIKTTKNGYKAPLGTKFYLTAEYSLTRHDVVGFLMRGEMLDGVMHRSATLSYNKWFFNMLSASVSYSYENRSYTNIGLGMALNLGALQIYVVSDNIYCLFNPETVRTANVHFGLNFIFGYREKKPSHSLYQDTP